MFNFFNSKFICGVLVTAVALCASCSKDDEPSDPNKPGNVDSNTSVADPVGTVTMRMRNDNETKLGQMIVSPENNFSCSRGMIASIGQVAGLGNITDIPLTGWSDNVAVTIGNGYVYYDGNQYYRIYAVQWLYEAGTTNAIIGVELKYQAPFKGIDEDLIPEAPAISFSDEGGNDQILFTNTSVIPFTVESDQSWCQVSRYASTDKNEYFLYDGIDVTVLPNAEMEQTTAKITVKTLYGKRTIINVTRAGQAPTILFPNGETEYTQDEVSANGETTVITLTTNVESEDFKAVSNVDWITIDESRADSRAMKNMTLRYTVQPNITAGIREGKITLSSVKGENSSVLTISQLAGTLSAQDPIEVTATTTSANLTFSTNVFVQYNVASSAAWCKVGNISNNMVEPTSSGRITLRLEMEPNTTETDRDATITVTANNGSLKASTKVTQKGVSFASLPSTLYFTRNRQNTTVTLPISNLVAKSGADWCQVTVNGTNLVVLVDDATVNRTTQITFEGTSAKITIDQSKYAVGDAYNESGIEGTVIVMDGATRLVRSDDLGTAAYSTEEFVIGATDMTNGMVNMTRVKSLSSWRNYYPAFALCDDLNVNGVTGWYLPAAEEVTGLTGAWSSTESSASNAYYIDSRSYVSGKKSVKRHVYAVHLFVQ